MHDILMGVHKSVAKNMLRIQQIENILKAIANRDLDQLKSLSRQPGGFVHDCLRKIVWPILLHTQHGNYVVEKGSEKDLADPVQIAKDVERSLYYYPRDMPPVLKEQKQQELHCMIVEILWRNPNLKYYQGFHDICTCFLLVLGKKAAIPAAENVALFFLRDAMMDSFEPVSKQLRRDEILKADRDIVHSLITRIPQDIDIELIIQRAIQLQEKYTVLQLQKQSGIWLHEESVINTWHKDWGTLKWGDVPDHLQASKYPSTQANKEEWEDEMLTEWTKRRRTSIIDDQDLF
ncbi:hypothetical protein RMCBS344292_10577 [Rhizopus microsporus]|nr:hypothetical protein RMCBS344292_10577 [Rhizopus microsporus]